MSGETCVVYTGGIAEMKWFFSNYLHATPETTGLRLCESERVNPAPRETGWVVKAAECVPVRQYVEQALKDNFSNVDFKVAQSVVRTVFGLLREVEVMLDNPTRASRLTALAAKHYGKHEPLSEARLTLLYESILEVVAPSWKSTGVRFFKQILLNSLWRGVYSLGAMFDIDSYPEQLENVLHNVMVAYRNKRLMQPPGPSKPKKTIAKTKSTTCIPPEFAHVFATVGDTYRKEQDNMVAAMNDRTRLAKALREAEERVEKTRNACNAARQELQDRLTECTDMVVVWP